MSITFITIDQMRAAMHPDDWSDHIVTHRDAELLGLTFRNPEAEAKLFAWMRANGWQPESQAAGNVHWKRGREHIWLCDLVQDAAACIVCALRGDDDLLPQHGRIDQRDTRPGLEILAEIVNTQPEALDKQTAEQWDGGGLLVMVTK